MKNFILKCLKLPSPKSFKIIGRNPKIQSQYFDNIPLAIIDTETDQEYNECEFNDIAECKNLLEVKNLDYKTFAMINSTSYLSFSLLQYNNIDWNKSYKAISIIDKLYNSPEKIKDYYLNLLNLAKFESNDLLASKTNISQIFENNLRCLNYDFHSYQYTAFASLIGTIKNYASNQEMEKCSEQEPAKNITDPIFNGSHNYSIKYCCFPK